MPDSPLDNGTSTDAQRFEDDVASVYRSLGYSVERNVHLGGQQIDVLATQVRPAAPTEILAVECKRWTRNNISNQDVFEFASMVAELVRIGVVTGGVMVCLRGYSKDAIAVARSNPWITLLTRDDLTRDLLTLATARDAAIQRYQQSDLGELYINLDARTADWTADGIALRPVSVPDIEHHLLRWIDSREAFATFVLADYGAGKSSLLRNLQYRLLTRPTRGSMLPVVVELKEYHRTPDVLELIRAAIRQDFAIDTSPAVLREQIDGGHIILMFDGLDEMLDRSDPAKRLGLIELLMPFLQSPSATLLTSRPSYVMMPQELAEIARRFSQWTKPVPVGRQSRGRRPPKPGTERLVSLKERIRDRNPRHHDQSRTAPRSLTAAAFLFLAPLSFDKIAEYVYRQAGDLESSTGFSAEAVIDFITRTYDLRDLAERPMLLKLIIDTVHEGGIDIGDEDAQYGPSSLYEIYTTLKLEFDSEKGASRSAMTGEARRAFAQIIATRMHRDGRLDATLTDVVDDIGAAASELATEHPEISLLTSDEIITDFLTCTFLRLDLDGVCRFVHKSFREFFVARTIKDIARLRFEFFETDLAREVLYFLGGFAPTEPRVQNVLWGEFKASGKGSRVRRRNLLGAYLYTQPNHERRVVRSADLWDLSYRALTLDQWTISRVNLDRVDVESLSLTECEASELTLRDCTVGELRLDNGGFTGGMSHTDIGELTVTGGRAALELSSGLVNRLTARHGDVSIQLTGASVDEFSAEGGSVFLDIDASSRVVSGTVERCVLTWRRQGMSSDGHVAVRNSMLTVAEPQQLATFDVRACLVSGLEWVGSIPTTTWAGLHQALVVVSPAAVWTDDSDDTNFVVGAATTRRAAHGGHLPPGLYFAAGEFDDASLRDRGWRRFGNGVLVCTTEWWEGPLDSERRPLRNLVRDAELFATTGYRDQAAVGDLVGDFRARISELGRI